MEITILMPCLNEEHTVGQCIIEAKKCLDSLNVESEILIVDNGSCDNSVNVAESHGARVISCTRKGYGNALRYGLHNAKGRYIIYADCDMSYDFMETKIIYYKLLKGCDMVVGDRFHPFPSKDAMSLSHRIGVPILSAMGRVRYGVKVHDFHCGIRGIKRKCVKGLQLHALGMEFATEIIAKAGRNNLHIGQVPVTLRPDGRDKASHLRTVRDGLRHVMYMTHRLT